MLCCSVPVSIYQAIWTFRKYFTGLVRRVDLRSTYSYGSVFAFSFAGYTCGKKVLNKKDSEKADKNKQSHETFFISSKKQVRKQFSYMP